MRFAGAAFLWLVVLIASNSIVRAGPSTLPRYEGGDLPQAPRQHDAWIASPTTLPANLISATTVLFDQGLPDPRGCEYREIQIVVGSVWGGEGIVTTHGWVIPGQPQPRYAITWSGLVYPVQNVGPATSLRQDIEAAIAADRESIRQQKVANPNLPFSRMLGRALPEDATTDIKGLWPLRVCFLLRLGEAELAAAYWKQWTEGLPTRTNNNDEAVADPYLELASAWAWSMFDRTVCSQMRGDDRLAVQSVQTLALVQPKIEAEAARRGYRRPLVMNSDDMNRPRTDPPYLGFLRPLESLARDAQRRVEQRPVERVLEHPEKHVQKDERIAGLIRDLEEISERQWGQPGGVTIADSPVIKALEKVGEDAVPALLDVLEKDQRLTRSVSFGRDFSRDRHFISVAEAAYVALVQILKTNQFGPSTEHGFSSGPAAGTEIRAYWNANRSVSVEERWYRTLADDKASPQQWLEAASRIVQPVDVQVRGGWVTDVRRKPGEVPAMRGETLRNHAPPSVSELMTKRVPQIVDSVTDGSSAIVFRSNDATSVAIALSRWEPRAAIPVLREHIVRLKRIAKEKTIRGSNDQLLPRGIARMTQELARSGDPRCLSEYAEWVRSITPAEVDSNGDIVFRLLWEYPDNPAIADATNALFNGTRSPWASLVDMGDAPFWSSEHLLDAPMLGVAPFQTHVLRNLDDTTNAGTLKIDPRGGGEIKLARVLSGMYVRNNADPLLPDKGPELLIRVCDWYAWKLSFLEGTPLFELYWPLQKRDAALVSMRQFIRQYGSRFAYNADQAMLWEYPSTAQARMTFPLLDHPASEDDVKAGRAIFSLPADLPRRAVKLDQRPIKARWVTLQDYPQTIQINDSGTRRNGTKTEYDQSGLVWQAEEVLENGKWQRYYGFVGHYIVARAPADQIVLTAGDPTTRP